MTTENRLFRAYGKGCARGTLLYSIVALIVMGGFCFISVLVLMLPIDDDLQIFIWVGLVIAFILVIVGSTALAAVTIIRKRASVLDEVFVPLGLAGRGYLTNGRQYHGNYRGCDFHVYFYRGPTLQIYLDVPLGTRIGIGRHGAISSLAADINDTHSLPLDNPAFEHLVVYPDDPLWAADLFANLQAQEIILRLMDEDSPSELRILSFTPSALLWQSRYNIVQNISPDNARGWINDLCELAQIARGLRSPKLPSKESSLEHTTRTDRSKFTWPVVGITCGVIAAMIVCIIGISAIVIILAENGL